MGRSAVEPIIDKLEVVRRTPAIEIGLCSADSAISIAAWRQTLPGQAGPASGE